MFHVSGFVLGNYFVTKSQVEENAYLSNQKLIGAHARVRSYCFIQRSVQFVSVIII